MGLFDIFKKNPIKSKGLEPGSFFYHEDDFLQVEIVPAKNREDLLTESKIVQKFSKAHFDGSGYTDVHVRQAKSVKLKELKIGHLSLEETLRSLELDRTDNVYTGYGQNHRVQHENCIAFHRIASAVLYDFKDDFVQNIWLTSHWSMDKTKLSNCLFDLGKQWPLILQDWNLTATIDLKNKTAIDDYLNTYDRKENKI